MKNHHRVVGSVLSMFGLLCNPWLLAHAFSNDGHITSVPVLIGVLFFDLASVIFGVSVWRSRSTHWLNVGLLVLSVLVTITLTVIADRVYGRFLMPETDQVLFPAFSTAHHRTSEFDLTVQINNLGFRGPNVTVEKSRKRVMLLGDSFTFGWGVEWHQTWVHQLARQYPDVEFLNLGRGGDHPGDYVRVAKKAIPLLRPDLVMVGVLQANDVHQLMRVIEYEALGNQPRPVSRSESVKERFNRYLGLVYPNFMKRFPGGVSIQAQWKKDAVTVLSEFSPDQTRSYRQLSSSIRHDFEQGLLNPSLIYEAMHHPRMYSESVDTANHLCKMAIVRLHDHLLELKELVEHQHAELIVLSIPNRPYGMAMELQPLAELGFTVQGCDTLNADLPFILAQTGTGIERLDHFVLKGNGPLFYRYDGHWNAQGNRIFAEQLIGRLDTLPIWKHFLTY